MGIITHRKHCLKHGFLFIKLGATIHASVCSPQVVAMIVDLLTLVDDTISAGRSELAPDISSRFPRRRLETITKVPVGDKRTPAHSGPGTSTTWPLPNVPTNDLRGRALIPTAATRCDHTQHKRVIVE